MTNIKNAIFDLGGVLIDWNPRYLYRSVFNDESSMEVFLQEMFTEEATLYEDLGRPLAERIAAFGERHPEKADLGKIYMERWAETMGSEIKGTVKILNNLKRRSISLYALTNWSNETFPYAQQRFEFLNNFADIVVSGTEKVAKPDEQIYRILLQRNNIKAHESVFVDDRLVNVEAAEAVGIIGIHFTSPEKLKKDLRSLKVI